MGQVTQQLLLLADGALQALRHLIERAPQIAQLILTAGGLARHPCAQLVGAPGVSLLAQLIERHDQQAIKADTQE